VQTAAVAHQCAARGCRDDLAERVDAILAWHGALSLGWQGGSASVGGSRGAAIGDPDAREAEGEPMLAAACDQARSSHVRLSGAGAGDTTIISVPNSLQQAAPRARPARVAWSQ